MSLQHYPRCTTLLQLAGIPYPRTCQECGLGPCKRVPPTEAPRSPAQPDAALLRDMLDWMTRSPNCFKICVECDCGKKELCARIDAFLAKANHG